MRCWLRTVLICLRHFAHCITAIYLLSIIHFLLNITISYVLGITVSYLLSIIISNLFRITVNNLLYTSCSVQVNILWKSWGCTQIKGLLMVSSFSLLSQKCYTPPVN